MKPKVVLFLLGALMVVPRASCQEWPYFVTYSQQMEEPDNLEIEMFGATGTPSGGNRFFGWNTEFEYGATAWWTTEVYLDAQTTANESTVFTGVRWENRIRPLWREYWINPVLYFEFEHLGADKTLREIVGHDGKADLLEPNAEANADKANEIELRLILGSNFHGWNLSENIILEKNLAHAPWEFGYGIATSRPLKLAASAHPCTFCLERWQAGLELYGGLGDRDSFGLNNTSQYLGPTVNWSSRNGFTVGFSPQWGLNNYSLARIYRFNVSYEISNFFGRMARR